MRSLSNLVPHVTKSALGKKGLLFGKLLMNWVDVMGPQKAKLAIPDRISFYGAETVKGVKTGATLQLATTSAYATLLEHEKELIKEKINTYLGYYAIANIKFVHTLNASHKALPQRPKPQKKLDIDEIENIEQMLEQINDEELKKALYNYGYQITLNTKETEQ